VRRLLALPLVAVLFVGCGGDTDASSTVTESAGEGQEGASAPELAVSELFRLLGREQIGDLSHLSVSGQMVVVALIEGVSPADAELLQTTGTEQVARNFWLGFRGSIEDALAADTIDLRIGGVQPVEAAGETFARVDVLFPLDGSARTFVVKEEADGWRVDLVATFAPALVPKIPAVADAVRRDGSEATLDVLRALDSSLQAVLTDEDLEPTLSQAVTAALESIRR
jgi:hypothetical protein